MTRMRAYIRRHGVSILVLIAMAAIWQLLSMTFTAEAVPGEPMIPGWQVVFTRTLISLADYWQGGLGVKSVAEGAPPSYLAALLAIVSNSFDTIVRLYVGLFGDQNHATLAGAVATFCGLSQAASEALLGLLFPVVLGTISKQLGASSFNASRLTSLLAAQKDNFTAALPSDFADRLRGHWAARCAG